MIDSGTAGAGNGGAVTVQAQDMALTNGASINTGIGRTNPDGTIDGFKNGAGRGGNISITAHDTLSVSSLSSIRSNASTGQGDAGNISISGGRLNISNSLITSVTQIDARGDGGNLKTNVGSLDVRDGGKILASAETSGVVATYPSRPTTRWS